MATLIEYKAPQIPPIIVFPETVKNSKYNNLWLYTSDFCSQLHPKVVFHK